MPAPFPVLLKAPGFWRHSGVSVLIVALLELGLLLLVLPWTGLWQHNYWVHAGATAWVLSPYCRGAVSGLGLVNLWLGTGEISHFRR